MDSTSRTILPLVQRYFEDGIRRRELDVLGEILHPDYIVHTHGETLTGRDKHYIPAVKAYLERHSDIGVRLHDVICNGQYAAVHMTKITNEPAAAWKTILLYKGVPGRHLTECWYEQDWASYRSQTRGLEPVPPLGQSLRRPWRDTSAKGDPSCDQAALRWLEGRLDEGRLGVAAAFAVESVSVDCLFTTGSRFAFHLTGQPPHSSGTDTADSFMASAAPVVLAGLGTVINGKVVDVHAVSDQGAGRRVLRGEANP